MAVERMFLGQALADRLAANSLRGAFAWIIIALGLFLLFSNAIPRA